VIVGGGKRGVVSAACYIARTYGVRSAMPMFKALALCPSATVISPDMAKYVRVGREVRRAMEALTPLVEPLSIDEAFLDLSGTERVHGMTPAKVLARFAREFDKAPVAADRIAAAPADFEAAFGAVESEVIAAIEYAVDGIRRFHEAQKPEEMWMKEIRPGAFAGDRFMPIPSVACYVPRGKGSFPSVVMMTTIPAVVAGVPRIAVITPPGPDGNVDAATLVAAKLAGVKEVYKCGGAQGVAAVAYGTQTVPKMAKIVGPGSPYVVAAKRLLADVIDPGIPAGPSESIILCDETANGRIAALGYCFGGMTVLELARSGADLRAAISVHGTLSTPVPAFPGKIQSKLLICHGALDPHVPLTQVTTFIEEMSAAKADWQLIAYSGAQHGFTHENATNAPGVAYNAQADARSQLHIRIFLQEIFIQ